MRKCANVTKSVVVRFTADRSPTRFNFPRRLMTVLTIVLTFTFMPFAAKQQGPIKANVIAAVAVAHSCLN